MIVYNTASLFIQKLQLKKAGNAQIRKIKVEVVEYLLLFLFKYLQGADKQKGKRHILRVNCSSLI
jgi:hypothetical protein